MFCTISRTNKCKFGSEHILVGVIHFVEKTSLYESSKHMQMRLPGFQCGGGAGGEGGRQRRVASV